MSSTKGKYILGGGITGLAAAYYFEDYQVISTPPHIPSLSEGPYYLHVSALSSELLASLGLQIGTRTIQYGYLKGKRVEPPTTAVLSEYHQRTYNRDMSPEYAAKHADGSHQIYEVTMEQLYQSLHAWCGDRIIGDEVLGISEDRVRCRFATYKASTIISTLPAPLMSKLRCKPLSYQYKPIHIAKAPADLFPVNIYDTDYEYLYLLDCKAHRITKWMEPWVVVESYLPLDLPGEKIFQYGKLVSAPVPWEGIPRVGRWAKWENGYLFKDALKDIRELGARGY
ncbi:MAG: hypothetical protein PHI12_07855 [Dehalococcoidales bacterium]|jgi:hypothetical protein|nr:hypothetical protein [Dehalococcoidales bacterium]